MTAVLGMSAKEDASDASATFLKIEDEVAIARAAR